MAVFEVLSIRPRATIIQDWDALRKWCNEHDSTLNSVINSFIPAICHAVHTNLVEDLKQGIRYIHSDFGDVELYESNYTRKTPNYIPIEEETEKHRKINRKSYANKQRKAGKPPVRPNI